MVPAVLRTSRLLLRVPSVADDRAIFEGYATDPDVTRYLRWRPHASLADTIAFLHQTIAAIETGAEAQWVIEPYALERPIGMIGFRLAGHAAELGYVLERAWWGRGYATEAAKAVVDWAVAEPGIYRAWAVCDVEHQASARVLEKVGMEREGVLRRGIVLPNLSPEPRDCWCYARVR